MGQLKVASSGDFDDIEESEDMKSEGCRVGPIEKKMPNSQMNDAKEEDEGSVQPCR